MGKKSKKSDTAPSSVTDEQLLKMLARYRAVTTSRLELESDGPRDQFGKVIELADAAEQMIRDGQHADARQLVGLVQGILYALGVHRWEYIATDDER